jgi:ribosomal protein L11 methyltransferase
LTGSFFYTFASELSNMDYNKVTIKITPFQEWLGDVLNSQLADVGFDSFVEIENGIEAFIPANLFEEERVNEILSNFENDFQFETESEFIKDQNWNTEWEKHYFKPLIIGNELLIRAPFHTEYPNAKYEIVIEPNMAFGTGNHETTATIIESILKNNLTGKTILDMGCGTGILSILASMKGAEQITAIDIDKWSYEGTLENAQLNNIKNIDIYLGDASLLGENSFDLIFANIHKNVLLNDMQAYFNVLNPGSTLIMSGFYTEDIPDIKEKAERLGMKDAGFVDKNNWVAHSFVKQ